MIERLIDYLISLGFVYEARTIAQSDSLVLCYEAHFDEVFENVLTKERYEYRDKENGIACIWSWAHALTWYEVQVSIGGVLCVFGRAVKSAIHAFFMSIGG